jgi:hypothetical protein
LRTGSSTKSDSRHGSSAPASRTSGRASRRCSNARARTRASLRAGARSRLRQRDPGVELAKRGWQVTGVDFVPNALRRARERVRPAGVELRLIEGDVTRLRDFDVARALRPPPPPYARPRPRARQPGCSAEAASKPAARTSGAAELTRKNTSKACEHLLSICRFELWSRRFLGRS